MKSCNDFKYALFEDHGYSNYTVEGTTFRCGLKLHDVEEFDRFYGEDERLNFAENCSGYKIGQSIEMDVEKEDYESLTPEQKAIFDDDKEAIKKFQFNDDFEEYLE